MIRKRLRLDITTTGAYTYERRPTSYLQRTAAQREVAPEPVRPKPSASAAIMDVRPPWQRTQQAGVTAKAVHAVRPKRSAKLIAKRPVVTGQRQIALKPAQRPVSRPVESSIPSSDVPPEAPQKQHGLKRHVTRQNTLYALAVIVFLVGAGASLYGFHTNRQVAAQVSHQAQKNDDDTSAVPSTAKPSAKDVSSYAVAPNMPRYIDITKLGVHARVLPMSVTSRNQLRAPGNVYDAGWYNGSALPGQAGAMLVDGHVSSWETNGVFYGLKKLTKGDTITITRGDGKAFTYTVVKNEKYDAAKVDMASLMVSADTAKPGLNIITCAGDVVKGTNEFADRQVVYAVQQ